jgi:hypothetical protein
VVGAAEGVGGGPNHRPEWVTRPKPHQPGPSGAIVLAE